MNKELHVPDSALCGHKGAPDADPRQSGSWLTSSNIEMNFTDMM